MTCKFESEDKYVNVLLERIRALEEQIASVRVFPNPPNEEALSRGLLVGSTVLTPNGKVGVVVAYDSDGDPLLQGEGLVSGRFDMEPCFSSDLKLLLPPSPPKESKK